VRRLFRVIVVSGLAFAILLVVVAGTGIFVVRHSFPSYDGSIELPGLEADVEVVRDANGIPQIYADRPGDLFEAQGYVHAQDRFFEMDFRRHVTSGRLAELFGEAALDTDKFVRTLGWRRVAEKELRLLAPATRSYLDAYAQGGERLPRPALGLRPVAGVRRAVTEARRPGLPPGAVDRG
jgi:penicillin amidase